MQLLLAALVFTSCATSPGANDGDLIAGAANWEAQVRERLLMADADGSGALEASESLFIPCDTWLELEADLRQTTRSSLAVVYGFSPGLLYRGHRLGVASAARESIDDRLTECVSAPFSPVPNEPVAFAIRELREFPVSSDWEHRVAELLLGHHDADRSGRLDTSLEVQAISCETFAALDAATTSATGTHLGVLYGIEPGYIWAGNTLGFDETIRDLLGEHLLACDLETS